MTADAPRLACSYVLPLRRWQAQPMDELVAYLTELAAAVDDVVVVDGSDPDVWMAHDGVLPPAVRHLEVDPGRRTPNGKVGGVLTGIHAARHERIVLADDDVRYHRAALSAVVERLDRAHLVRPQNHFDPLPWHARWDTARTLLNRAFAADYPGTLGVRRSAVLATGGYDGDVLFENLELIRTIAAAGGTVDHAVDVYVARRPPDPRHFWGQRVRQAYDSFATPGRLVAELAVGPVLVALVVRRRTWGLAGLAAGVMAVAERGRRRAGGAAVFPPSASLLAPVWLAERAVCAWLAVDRRLRGGGVGYAGVVLRRAATPSAVLRRRLAGRLDGGPAPIRGMAGTMTNADDERLAQPDPDEVQLTDNSAGAPVDDHRLEEAEEETRQQEPG